MKIFLQYPSAINHVNWTSIALSYTIPRRYSGKTYWRQRMRLVARMLLKFH